MNKKTEDNSMRGTIDYSRKANWYKIPEITKEFDTWKSRACLTPEGKAALTPENLLFLTPVKS